jgi:iron complex outermembrane receptor protein
MSKNTLLQRAIRLALANAAAASVALPVAAMAADATGPDAPQAAPATATQPALQEVVVTGSRIIQPGLKSISPVTAISAKEIASQGTTSIEDVLNNLPQVVADQGSMSSNGASGTATVNLRDLGPARTLVLINGRRLMPGDATNAPGLASAADLNNIPIQLVERVDVLTGGASAVYGADAVAGVVNFVMNDHFQGFEVDVNGAGNWHNQHSYWGQFAPAHGYGSAASTVLDGVTKDVTFIMGSNFADGKGNATAYVSYRKEAPLLEAARDFSRCTLNGTACSGSSTSATGRFFASGFLPSAPSTPNFFAPPFLTVNPATGQLVPWTSADAFNYGALNYYQRPDERWNAGSFIHYDIDDNHQVYSEFMFMNDETDAQIAPSGAFIGSGTGTNPVTGNPDGDWAINCNNPYLSNQEATTLGCTPAMIASTGASLANEVQVLFGRRNFEGGNRADLLTHTSFRFVIGSKGQITDNLSYNVYAQEGQTLHSEEYVNDVSKARLSNAFLAVTDPATGQIVCAANAGGKGGAPGCVPYDIWGVSPANPSGAVNLASVNYFSVPGLIEGKAEERVYHADFTSDMTNYVKLPSANEGLGVNFGAEYRQEFATLRPDLEFQTADLAGQGSATLPLNAGYGVKEGFVEARLPLVQDKPFLKEVSIDLGYRYSKYDVGYTTSTYKFEADWSPTSDIRFRGGYNRAVRAPNIAELFAQDFVALDGSLDPCASSSGSPAPATAGQCARSGLSPAQYGTLGTPGNPAGQYNGLIGGNPKLKPEIADTYTFGIVVTPSVLPSLNATLDVFDIKIKDLISSYGANLIVSQCVYDDNPQFCSMVHRDSAGSLWFSTSGYVADPLLNLGFEKTAGMDASVNYTQNVGWLGSINFNMIGTYTASFITEPYPGSGDYNCAGYFGGTCGNPLPKWRHTMTVGWATPWHGLGVEARWRHIGNTEIDTANPSPLLSAKVNPLIQYTGSRDYLDLIGTDQIFSGVQLQIGINNLFDKDPPILATNALPPPFFNGNTYPQVYDTLGRYVFANLKIDF